MSRLRARCPSCRTLTAVGLGEAYECHSCGATFGAGLVRVPRAWGRGGERMAAAARLELPYPEAGVVDAATLAEQSLAIAATLPPRPIVLGGCCCAHVGAVEGLATQFGRLAVVWLDAHGDLNTPASSPSGNTWGMPLRMLLDAGTIAVADTALVGARNLDTPEEAFIADVSLPLGVDGIERALEGVDAVYVALDCDVLDPASGISVFMPEPGGLTLAAAEAILARLVTETPLAGLGLTGLTDDAENVEIVAKLCRATGL